MILDRILEHKKAEIRHKLSRGYLIDLKEKIRDRQPTISFALNLEATKMASHPALIAEVKKASPSLGLLREDFQQQFDPVAIAKEYKDSGASAVSVLTDEEFFQGNLTYLLAVKEEVGLPALNKEFMVHEIQFYEARAYGADAVLLIVAALERKQLQDFFALSQDLTLDVLIETHHERELDMVLEWIPEARLIGINNRDLHTFTTDLGITERLAKRIPKDKVIVSESGIHTRADVEEIMKAGAQGMLVGESLIRAESTRDKIKELFAIST